MTQHSSAEQSQALKDLHFLASDKDISETEETDTQTNRPSDIQDSHDLHDSQEETEGQAPDVSLPLPQYTVEAERYSRSRCESASKWVRRTWHFTLVMKRHPELRDLAVGAFMNAIPWSLTGWTEIDRLAIRVEFGKVDFAHCSQLELAAELAESRPLVWNEDSPLYNQFVSLAGWLQALQGGKPILLPVVRVGTLLGVDQRVVSDLRAMAEADGLLVVTRKHHPAGRATEFRFSIEVFPELQEDDS